MSDASGPQPRRIGRSMWALFAGFLTVVVLSVGTDFSLHALGIVPSLNQPDWGTGHLLLATAYRALYGVISGYVVARLAPHHPMEHALVGGVLGLVLASIGAAATWNSGLGPRWYPLALVVLAMPQAWAGGSLRLRQLRSGTSGRT